MDNNRINELLIKEASKSLTPLQSEELSLLRQLQENIAAQAAEAAAAQAPAVEITAPEPEPEVEAEVVVEEVPTTDVVETPEVVDGEIVEDEAPTLGVATKN